jgi:hypothetical protein
MKDSKAHFEQIPVETVKRIAHELPDPVEVDDVTSEIKTEVAIEVADPQKRWREMAEMVQVENDPQRMIQLVEDLITAFDEEEPRKSW